MNGWSTVPVPQCVLAGIPPTAAIGLAFTSDDPVATAAVSEVELVIIPQPRSTSALPVAVMPVTEVLSRLMTQYLPDGTMVAVAFAVIVGVALMNMPEKLSCFCTESATLHGISVRGIGSRSSAGWSPTRSVVIPTWLNYSERSRVTASVTVALIARWHKRRRSPPESAAR